MKNLTPHGEMVLIEFVEVPRDKDSFKANASGILVKTPEDEVKYQARILSVGDKVDLSAQTWKVGDIVIYNNYNCLKFGDKGGRLYGLIKEADVWASYTD